MSGSDETRRKCWRVKVVVALVFELLRLFFFFSLFSIRRLVAPSRCLSLLEWAAPDLGTAPFSRPWQRHLPLFTGHHITDASIDSFFFDSINRRDLFWYFYSSFVWLANLGAQRILYSKPSDSFGWPILKRCNPYRPAITNETLD